MSIHLLRSSLPLPALTYDVRGQTLTVVVDESVPNDAVDAVVKAGVQALRRALRRT